MLTKLPDIPDTAFESLCYSKNDRKLLRDGEAVPGDSVSGFRVIDGELRIAASETVRAGETAEDTYLTLEEAAPMIGLETVETDNGVLVSDPFQSGTLIVKTEELPDTMGGSEIGSGWEDLHVLQYPTAADAYAAYQAYQEDDSVIYAEPNRVYHIAEAPAAKNDADGYQFPAENWGWDAIGADDFMTQYGERAAAGPEVKVAVIDTGIYGNHNWFKNRIAEGGRSFVEENGGSYDDVHGHGTHCSGIICGMTPENVKILPLRVFNSEGAGYELNIYCAMMYAAEQNADVASMSFGGTGVSPMMEEAIRVMQEKDMVCVVAAGNDAYDTKYNHPSSIPEVITVSSLSNHYDDYYEWMGFHDTRTPAEKANAAYWLSPYSNFGQRIDFAAPGDGILSAYITSPNSTASMSGTSMACPHVAACAADILTIRNNYSYREVYDCLKANAIDLGEPGFDEKYGWGMVSLSDPDFDFSALPQPEATVTSGNYRDVFTVKLSTPEPDAEIRYTTDGSYPDAETGILYQGEEILIDNTTDLYAVTVKNGARSSREHWRYVLSVNRPLLTPAPGNYDEAVTVSVPAWLADRVYYTLDGSEPTPENGIRYTGPIELTETTLIRMIVCIGRYVSEPFGYLYTIDGQKSEQMFRAKDGVLLEYYGQEKDLDLNDYFEPDEITMIGKGVFQENTALESIVLPDSVTVIDEEAFAFCTALRSVTARGAEYIGKLCFDSDQHLSALKMPALKVIGPYAFSEALMPGTVAFADNNQIETIEECAFESSGLQNAVFPNLKTLEAAAFSSCVKLNKAVLPPNITVLPTGVFGNCLGLTTLDAPGVTVLEDYALSFLGDVNVLSSCTIDFAKLTSIGEEALAGFECCEMKRVSFDSLTEIKGGSFYRFPAKELHLPALKYVPADAFIFSKCSFAFLDSAERLEKGLLNYKTDDQLSITYIFGDSVLGGQKNPLIPELKQITIAAPADSPMIRFAQAAQINYYYTPDILVPDDFTACKQHETVCLDDCVPLACNSRIEFTTVETDYIPGFFEPEAAFFTDDKGNVLLETCSPGNVTIRADLINDAGDILTSKLLEFTIQSVESAGFTTKEGVFVFNWNNTEFEIIKTDEEYGISFYDYYGINRFRFEPEEDGKYSFIPECQQEETITVYNEQNEQIGYFGSYDHTRSNQYPPVMLEAGASYEVVVELRSSLDPRYPLNPEIPIDAILITREQPSAFLGDIRLELPSDDETDPIDTNDIKVYRNGKPFPLTPDVDYHLHIMQEDDTTVAYIFGMGRFYGWCSVELNPKEADPTTLEYNEYTFGETVILPELKPHEAVGYHVQKNDDSGLFLIYADYSEAYWKDYTSGKALGNHLTTKLSAYVLDADQTMISEMRLDYESQAPISENVYALASIVTNDYYIVLSNNTDQTAPAGMYAMYTKDYRPDYSLGNCELDIAINLSYNGKKLDFVRSIKNRRGETLTEGKDYAVYYQNDCLPWYDGFYHEIPLSNNFEIVGIGDYTGVVSTNAGIDLPYLTTGPYAPEQIRQDEPFILDQYCNYYEIETRNSYQCRLRKTASSDPDASYNYVVFSYDKSTNNWKLNHFGNGVEELAALELTAGKHRIFISQYAQDMEFVLETLEQTMTGIVNAEVHSKTLEYTGEILQPEITLTYDGRTLTEGEDYVILLPEQPIKDCGIYSLTITGIGDFSGDTTVCVIVTAGDSAGLQELKTGENVLTFTAPEQTAAAEWIPDKAHYGISMNELQIASLAVIDPETNEVACALNGMGYLCDFFEVTPGKTYLVYASWFDSSCTEDLRCTLLSEYTDLTACTVEAEKQMIYTEGNTPPELTVKNGETVLQEGTDYKVYYYGGNDRPGHAVISLIGIGSSIGELQFHYYLAPEPDPEAFEADEEKLTLKRNKVITERILMPGDFRRFEFQAPEAGQYSFDRPDPEYSGVNVFAYGPDMELLPLDTNTVTLKKGELLRFIAVYDHILVDYDYSYNIAVYSDMLGYELRTGNCVWLIRGGSAYLKQYDGENIGIQLPETVHDPEQDLDIPVAGYTEEAVAALCDTRTLYCKQDSESYEFMQNAGVCFAVPDPQTGIRGDITGDGIVSVNDWLTLMRWLNESPGMLMSDSAYAAADLNEDGCLDMLDANAVAALASAEET